MASNIYTDYNGYRVPVTPETLQLVRSAQKKDDKKSPNAAWIEEFGSNPRAFCGLLMGNEWYTADWAPWRAFICTLFGQPLRADELLIFQECTKLEAPPTWPGQAREAWIAVGRRGGKSRALALIACYLAICRNWTPYLSPGERGHISVLAAERKQASAIMSYIKAFLADDQLAHFVEKPLNETIEMQGMVTIEVVTASIRAVRSRTVICALCDEIAFWPAAEDSANLDDDVISALTPAMATIPNRMLLAASSPYARKGVLWENYKKHFGKSDGPLIWQAPTRTMHPSLPQEVIDDEYEKDPVSAAAEFGANFRTDVAAFVSREVVEDAVVPGRREQQPVKGLVYKGFIDPSGGSSDSMTLAIGHRDQRTRRGVLDLLVERRPPFKPEEVVAEFSSVLHRYRCSVIHGDNYAGEWPKEQFSKRGIRYEKSEKRKSDIYRDWLPLLNSGLCELLDNNTLINQTCSLERRVARGGRESIDHAPGQHDDCANSVAGVLVELVGKQMLRISNESVQRTRMANSPILGPQSHSSDLSRSPLHPSPSVVYRSRQRGAWTRRF